MSLYLSLFFLALSGTFGATATSYNGKGPDKALLGLGFVLLSVCGPFMLCFLFGYKSVRILFKVR